MLRGSLDDFTLPDIFRLMSLAKKTGRLEVTRREGRGGVLFRDGEVYFAESTVSKEPIGQRLIRSGALDDGQLQAALLRHQETGRRVGEILVEEGAVSNEQVEAAVRAQIEAAVFDLLRWGLGDFGWTPDVEVDVDVAISVSVENLILEASRRLEELEQITRKIPSEYAVLAMAKTPPEGAAQISITPEEWRLFVLVNGARTVHEIGGLVGMDDLEAMRSLHGLVSAGVVEVVGEEAPAPGPSALDAPPPPDPASPAEPTVEHLDAIEGSAEDEERIPVAEAVAQPSDDREDGFAGAFDVADVLETDDGAPDEVEKRGDELPDGRADHEEAEAVASEEDPADVLEDDGPPPPSEEPDVVRVKVETTEDLSDASAFEEIFGPYGGNGASEVAADDPEQTRNDDRDEAAGPAVDGAEDDGAASDGAAQTVTGQGPDAFLRELIESPANESAEVDRASVVREFSSLFHDAEPRMRARSRAAEAAPPDPARRKRVEDDEHVTRGLISRLIDGVKGL